MSLIEKAIDRLDQLRHAEMEPVRDEPVLQDVAEPLSDTESDVETVQEQVSSQAGQGQQSVPHAHLGRAVDVDLSRLERIGMVTPTLPRSMIAEEYRVIKRPLLRNAEGRGAVAIDNGNLVMITSALPGEGKSFTAINLAMSIAMELDHTVLLVDADFSRPSILKLLGLPPEKGLMDVLVGDVQDLSKVLLRTNLEKLSILPAGMSQPHATELIASDAMNRMLEEMSLRYAERIIIFDSPPLLATTEARVLATHMGQVVVVVESDRTTHGTLRQALATIESCPVKSLVLNKIQEAGRRSIYGYGYGYGYGADLRSDSNSAAPG